MLLLLCVLCGLFLSALTTANDPERPIPPHSDVEFHAPANDPYAWTQARWVAHALGDIEGIDYTNSLEAFQQSLAEDYRCVEFDLVWDECGVWILRHEDQIIAPYHVLTLTEFLSILSQHPTVSAILDSKTRTQVGLDRVLKAIQQETAALDRSVLDQLVIQTYSFDQYRRVSQQDIFHSVILTLYGTSYTEDQVVAYAKEAKVKVITMPWIKANPTYIHRLQEAGVIVYVHTVNSASVFARMLAMGVQGIYTDVVLPLPNDPSMSLD